MAENPISHLSSVNLSKYMKREKKYATPPHQKWTLK